MIQNKFLYIFMVNNHFIAYNFKVNYFQIELGDILFRTD